MSEEKKVSLGEMGSADLIKLTPNLIIASKPNLHTIRLMERRFKVPATRFNTIDFNFIDNIISALFLLAKQVNENITEEEVEKELEKSDFQKIGEILTDAFRVESKKKEVEIEEEK